MSRNFTFTNGKHVYKGKSNSRAQRFSSKLYKGLKKPRKEVWQLIDKLSLTPG